MALGKVRVQLLDEETGAVIKEVDVLTSADAVTFADGQTFQQKLDLGILSGAQGPKGDTGAAGATGQRGSQWFNGTAITGTSTTGTIFSGSGIISALLNDQYYNTSTGNVYVCTLAGNASTAKWTFSICLKGATGANGAQGPKGDTGSQGIQGPKGADGDSVKVGANYSTGTPVKLFFKEV